MSTHTLLNKSLFNFVTLLQPKSIQRLLCCNFKSNESILTCELAMTWLASSWIGNWIPSSDEKDAIGDSVPDVRTIHRVWEPISEKTWEWTKPRHSRWCKLNIDLLHRTEVHSSNSSETLPNSHLKLREDVLNYLWFHLRVNR